MDFVKTVELGRSIRRLKAVSTLSLEERAALLDRIAAVGPAAIPQLLRCLSHAQARGPAAEVLERLLEDATLEAYVHALASPNPVLAAGVAKIMAGSSRYDASALLDQLTNPKIPRSVLEPILMQHAARIPSRRILSTLTALGPETRPVLFRLLERSTDEHVAPQLLELMEHQDSWVRLPAVQLVARWSGREVVDALVGRLEDDSARVRHAAVDGLHGLGDPTVVPALAQRLRDPDLKVQSAAIDALIGIGDQAAVPHLLEILADESEHARRGAVEVLNRVATTQAIQDLLRALRDRDWWVRVRAADALGSLGGEKVVVAVVGLLEDADEFVRRYAVEILNTVPSERAVLPLIGALRDSDWWVRERSIDALGNIRDARAVEPLLNLMRMDSKATPLCARALGRMGDPRCIDALCALVDSERDEVRREALGALAALSRQALPPEEKKKVANVLGDALRSGWNRDGRAEDGAADAQSPSLGARPATSSSPAPNKTTIRWDSNAPAAPKPAPGVVLHFTSLEPGMVLLERYRVIRKIGHGGFGAVYLVEDSAIQEEVILKLLNPLLSGDEKELRRFIQELKLTRRISHKNVIRIYDFLDLGGVHAVSMEYFEGRDLGHILDDDGALDAGRVLETMTHVCAGLAAAHDAGVVHRDIKPSNVLVRADDDVKIVDFGLASAQKRVGSRLTKSGLLIGTPEYMAPELIQGDSMDHRVDIYSVGIMMYEMLAGRKPYADDNPVRVLFKHLEGDADPLQDVVPGLSTEVVKLVERCMAVEADRRPADAHELQALVEKAHAALTSAECDKHG